MSVGNYCYENTRMWWTTKDGQGCHHLPPTTTVLWGGTQPEVTNQAEAPHLNYRVTDFRLTLRLEETPNG